MSTKKSPKPTAGARPLALIAGPTASGKSSVAVKLAQKLADKGKTGVVINADSAQVYSDLRVLSARPSDKEMDGIEHRLFGAWDGAETCSAADWAVRAKAEIAECHASGAVPILVGGTGMYVKVLIEGIAPIPEINPEVREVVRTMSTKAAYAALMIEDPVRAAELTPNDSQRISRSLEVKRSTGVTLSDWQQTKTGGIGEEVDLYPLILMPKRQWVYERCDTRFAAMLKYGAIKEVGALVKRGLARDLPIMRAIGVSEIAALLRGEITQDEAIAAGAQATRNYAKRQFTWLRNQSPKEWPRVESQNIDIEAYFASLLQL